MMSDAVTKYEEQVKHVEEIAQEFKATIQDSMVGAFSAMAEAIGGVSDMNAGQVVASLLMPFADMAIKAGTIILTAGLGIDALKKALMSLTGPVANCGRSGINWRWCCCKGWVIRLGIRVVVEVVGRHQSAEDLLLIQTHLPQDKTK